MTRFTYLKRLIALLCILALALFALPALAFAEGEEGEEPVPVVYSWDVIGSHKVSEGKSYEQAAPAVDATSGVLITADGQVLWSRKGKNNANIASLTKIMTAVVALENGDLEEYYTLTDDPSDVDYAVTGLQKGKKMKLKNLLRRLLVLSDNGAALAIAQGVAGSEEAFVEMMNAKAKELGLEETYYCNPHGLDDGDYAGYQHSSAEDLARLCVYAMQNETFRDIVSRKSLTINDSDGNELTVRSTNILLRTYKPCIGIKTGFTDDAGYCLACAANKDGVELYAVVLGGSCDKARFDSGRTLLEWGYEHFHEAEIISTDTVVANVPACAWEDKSVPVVCAETASLGYFDFDDATTMLNCEFDVQEIRGDIAEGDAVGTIHWLLGEEEVANSALIATEAVPAPSFGEKVKIFFHRLFTSGPGHLELEVLIDEPYRIGSM